MDMESVLDWERSEDRTAQGEWKRVNVDFTEPAFSLPSLPPLPPSPKSLPGSTSTDHPYAGNGQ